MERMNNVVLRDFVREYVTKAEEHDIDTFVDVCEPNSAIKTVYGATDHVRVYDTNTGEVLLSVFYGTRRDGYECMHIESAAYKDGEIISDYIDMLTITDEDGNRVVISNENIKNYGSDYILIDEHTFESPQVFYLENEYLDDEVSNWVEDAIHIQFED